MLKTFIQENAWYVDTSKDTRKKLVSSFHASYDKEIVAVIASWLYNGCLGEDFVLEMTIEMLKPNPITYVMNPTYQWESDNGSFCGMMSNANFVNLLKNIRDANLVNGGMQQSFSSYMYTKRHKCKYVHDAFAYMFSGNTGFPTKSSKSTFFRYNYLYYLLYDLNIWDRNTIDFEKALLPCNDVIMQKAYQFGLTKRLLRSDLRGTIELSNISKQMFGIKDFYILYEFLNFANDETFCCYDEWRLHRKKG